MLNSQVETSRLRELLSLPAPALYSAEVVKGRLLYAESTFTHVEWLVARSLNALCIGSADTFAVGSPSMSQLVAMDDTHSAVSYSCLVFAVKR